ncbi:MAG: glycosyltransferase, partial [Desulfuromonadaceae bacterium]
CYILNLPTENINFRYIRNDENIGSDRNIAKSYNEALSDYVLILGDDDFLRPNALDIICRALIDEEPDLAYMNTCGFVQSQSEIPFSVSNKMKIYDKSSDFILSVNIGLTCISSVIFSKKKLLLDANYFIGTNLVQWGLALKICSTASKLIKFESYMVAYKRNNSGGYNYWNVFINNLFDLFDATFSQLPTLRNSLAKRLLIYHYPYYALKSKKAKKFNTNIICDNFDAYFNNIIIYRYLLRYIYSLPYFIFYLLAPLIYALRAINGEYRKIIVLFMKGL